MKRMLTGLMLTVTIMAGAWAAPAVAPVAPKEALTVAVFDFTARDPGLNENGRLIAELVRVELGNRNLRLVSREEIAKILEEQKLKLAGVTDEAAPRVGALLGAQVVVTGRVFDSAGKLIISSKAIGTETSRVFGDVARGERSQIDALGQEIGAKVADRIEKNPDALVAKIKLSGEQLAEMKKQLGSGPMPRVFVAIGEQVAGTPAPDPAAQTELGFILRRAGCEVVKDRGGEMAKWAQAYSIEGGRTAPPQTSEADIAIIGEGVSQLGARTGDLVSSRARVELEVIDFKTGKVLAIDRETYSATDLSEAVAAKAALQETAAKLAYRMLPEAIGAWRKAHAGDQTTTATTSR